MLIFNCTKATQDFFTTTQDGKKQSLAEAPPSDDMAEDNQHLYYDDGSPALPFQWVLHRVKVKAASYLVAMEVATRFSVVVAMAGKDDDLKSYLQYFTAVLSSQMLVYGQEQGAWGQADTVNIIGNCVTHTADVRLFKRSDRSVQSQINEVVRHLKIWAKDKPGQLKDDAGILRFCQEINQIKRKSQAFPEQDSILPVAQMLAFWQENYQSVESNSWASAQMASAPAHVGQPAISDKIGRNEVCPCGSGKKYKKCCLYQVA